MYILSDTHVHAYRCYAPQLLFESALRSLSHQASIRTCQAGALFLTERRTNSFFTILSEDLQVLVQEPEATLTRLSAKVLQLQFPSFIPLLIISGIQWVSESGIEILGLHTETPARKNLSESDILATIHAEGGVPVLPWSLGKWCGQRGRIIKELLEGPATPRFLLGDIPLRARGTCTPRLFELAIKRGLSIVGGSDPLPFPGQETRIGSYGSVLEVPSITPHALCQALWHPVDFYGERMSIMGATPLAVRALFSRPRGVDF